MTEIIPAILTDSAEELVRWIHIFERMGVERVHLDVADGVFVPARTVCGYEELARLDTKLKFDVHLMVQDPEAVCGQWCESKADRFLLHVEAIKHFGPFAIKASGCDKKIGAVINPETPMSVLEDSLGHVDLVQFMTVHPGQQGREFVPSVLERIKDFHAAHHDMPIMVDGGINTVTAPQCAAAGVSQLVAGSYIIRSMDPAKALQELRASVGL